MPNRMNPGGDDIKLFRYFFANSDKRLSASADFFFFCYIMDDFFPGYGIWNRLPFPPFTPFPFRN